MTGTSSEYARRADAHAEEAKHLLDRVPETVGEVKATRMMAMAQVHATLALADRQACHTLASMGR